MRGGLEGLTRREFLKGLGAAALGLTLSGLMPKESSGSECPEYRGVAPVDWDYTDRRYAYMRPFYEKWLDEIKDLGANAVEINIPVKRGHTYEVGYAKYGPHGEEVWIPFDDDEGTAENIKDYVRLAQSKGFKVILDIPHLGSGETVPQPFDLDQLYDNLEEFILKWAEIAEELGVEGYCPEGEFAFELPLYKRPCRVRPNGDLACPTPILAAWIKQLIPKVRERYSGNIIIQENPAKSPDIEFKGADYIGLHLHVQEGEHFIPGKTTYFFRQRVRREIDEARRVARRDGCKGVLVTEVSFGVIPSPDPLPDHTSVNEQQQKELCEAFFEEAWGKVDGIFLCSWGSEPEFHRTLQVTDRPAEEVVRRYYQSCRS